MNLIKVNAIPSAFNRADNIIDSLVENIISNPANQDRMIFDGYPRNLNQVKQLDFLLSKYDQKIFSVISLNVDKDTVVKRILGRMVCLKCGSIFNKNRSNFSAACGGH